MVAKKSYNSLLCHRCQLPMTFRASKLVTGKEMQVYECETCQTLEATDPKGPNKGASQPHL